MADRSYLIRFPLITVVAFLLFAAGSGGGPAHAADFTVDTTADAVDANAGDGLCDDGAGNCTLRAAIQETNALPGPDTITLPAGTYTLSIPGTDENAAATGDLDINDDLTITGAGADTSIIDGGALDRVFHIDHFSTGVAVKMSGATVRNGDAALHGGGIMVSFRGALTMADAIVSDNTSTSSGGGICAGLDTALTLTNVTVTGNVAGRSAVFAGGGGISGGPMTLTNVTVTNNRARGNGGGIDGGIEVTLIDSVVSGNEAGESGGGIFFNAGTIGGAMTMTVTGSTVSGNWGGAGGGIYTAIGNGTLSIVDSTLSGNKGGPAAAISLRSGNNATLTNVTVSGNGGTPAPKSQIVNDGHMTLTNVTVLTAAAHFDTWGISSHLGTMTLRNTLLASFALTDSPVDVENCSGPITSEGHNLDSDGTCGLTGPDDLSNVDPLLGPLAGNGGPTQTHALLSGSPAIDAGSDDCPPPETDQRGVARPIDGDGDATAVCDIGAYEAPEGTSAPTPVPTPSPKAGPAELPGTGGEPGSGSGAWTVAILLLMAGRWG